MVQLFESNQVLDSTVTIDIYDEYSNSDLTNSVKNHSNTATFVSNVTNAVVEHIKLHNNNIRELAIKDNGTGEIYSKYMKGKIDKPRYNGIFDTFTGLQIATNDIWAYEIFLEKYEIKGGEPHGQLNFKFYDHFGLDYPDIVKRHENIFIAWFVLQHFRGYKPFITKIEFIKDF